MGARDAMDRHGRKLAEVERKSGRLPDSAAIDRIVKADFQSISSSLKPGSTHPLANARDGERK